MLTKTRTTDRFVGRFANRALAVQMVKGKGAWGYDGTVREVMCLVIVGITYQPEGKPIPLCQTRRDLIIAGLTDGQRAGLGL